MVWNHGTRVLAMRLLESGHVASVAANCAWHLWGEAGASSGQASGRLKLGSAALASRAPAAAGVSGGRPVRFDLIAGAPALVLPFEGRATAAAVGPDGSWLAVGDDGGGVSILGEAGRVSGKLRLDRYPVTAIEVSPDSVWLAASTLGGGLWLVRREDLESL